MKPMHKPVVRRAVVPLALVLTLALCLLFPATAFAAALDIHSIDVTVDLQPDGSAWFTEVWSVRTIEGTELYINKSGLEDYQQIDSLSVTDETGRTFEDIGEWDVNASIDEKAGRCGAVRLSDGYELCWGFGTFGEHTYTVRYRMENLLIGYNDADMIVETFVNRPASNVGSVRVTIRSDNHFFRTEDTGIWGDVGEGNSGNIELIDGAVVAAVDGTFLADRPLDIMVEFAPGMFSPGVHEDMGFEEVRERALAQSTYEEEGDSPLEMLVFILVFGGIGAIVLIMAIIAIRSAYKKHKQLQAYKASPYNRALPWAGSLAATYKRLDELGEVKEGAIIGALFLRWLSRGQIAVLSESSRKKEKAALQLHPAQQDMPKLEQGLYKMLQRAAGDDGILQTKEFERWSKKHYSRVGAWFSECKNSGAEDMRALGALQTIPKKAFFGLASVSTTAYTQRGEQLTGEMFGFANYLTDFTIINEREAREVQLWNDYLVYAQLFGIAEAVANQFKALYPDYFTEMAQTGGMYMGGGLDVFDIILISRLANNYSYAMTSGYRTGFSEAQSSSWSGGGGGMSSGGGFSTGSSGGSGAR